MNKYFQFTGTINGTTYFLRNMISTLLSYIGGYSVGWFNVCTIFKRSNALFPSKATIITVGMVLFQVLGQVNEIFSIFPLVMGLILLFKNSNIENHEG